MAEDALIRFQLAHDAWATSLLLERCGSLALAEWRRPLGLGLGSLERNLAHLVECTWYFADAFRALPYEGRADFEGGAFTPQELLDQAGAAQANLGAAVLAFEKEHGLGARLALPAGSPRWLPGHVLLAQALDHGSHHRSQCLSMLEQLGRREGLELHPLRFAGLDD